MGLAITVLGIDLLPGHQLPRGLRKGIVEGPGQLPVLEGEAMEGFAADRLEDHFAAENTGNKRGHSSAGIPGIKRGQSC